MIKRGDVYYADLAGVKGSEQGGIRPVVVVQNDKGNRYSKTIIVAPISKKCQSLQFLHMLYLAILL